MQDKKLTIKCIDCESSNVRFLEEDSEYFCKECKNLWPSNNILTNQTEKDFCQGLANSEMWQEQVLSQWPAPIAHEYYQLRNILHEGQFVTGLLQLKDVVEVIVKFTTHTMYQWIRAYSPENEKIKEVEQKLFEKPLSLGSWLELIRILSQLIITDDNANKYLGKQIATWFYTPANSEGNRKNRHVATEVYMFLSDMVVWRNDEIGHGALSLDTKELWEDFDIKLSTLHQLLSKDDPWLNVVLYGIDKEDPNNSITLLGYDSIRARHQGLKKQISRQHRLNELELFIGYINTRDEYIRFSLSPYVQSHLCKDCGLQDIFMFDSLKGKTFHHLDYLTGHRTTLELHESFRLKQALDQAKFKLIDKGDSNLNNPAVNKEVVELLQSKSLESDYLQPLYLHKELNAFIESNNKGVFWLQAPAHIGKSLFVHNLANKKKKEYLSKNIIVVKFHIRREFRYFYHHFIESIAAQLKESFNITSGTEELPKINLNEGSAALVNWINQWWKISQKQYTHCLFIAIDGLDEIGIPDNTGSNTKVSILDILPTDSDLQLLEDDIYFFLTSRPLKECPKWMQNQLESTLNYTHNLQLTLQSPDYLNLLRQYFDRNLKQYLISINDVQKDELFEILLEKSEYRFLYFSLLANLINEQKMDLGQLKKLPEGEDLYAHYIKNLEKLLGVDSKQFMRIKKFLTLLTACEQASVMDVEIQDLITNANSRNSIPDTEQKNGSLYWKGLNLSTVAGLLGEPEGVWSANLVFTLYSLKSLIRVHRTEEQAHYRLGLKGLSSFINTYWESEVEKWHYKLSLNFYNTWKDNWDDLDSTNPENQYQLRYLLPHIKHTVRFYENEESYSSNCRLDANDCYTSIFSNIELTNKYRNEAARTHYKDDINSALEWLNIASYCVENSIYFNLNDNLESLDLSIKILKDRGILFSNLNKYKTAIADLLQARVRGQTILDKCLSEDQEYKIEWQYNYSSVLAGLADLENNIGEYDKALTAYEFSEFLLLDLKKRIVSNTFPSTWQLELARCFNNTALAYSYKNKIKESLEKFNISIDLYSELFLEKTEDTNLLHQLYSEYGNALTQRASFLKKINQNHEALSDFNLAIDLNLRLQELLADKYTSYHRNNLLSLLNNQGRLLSDLNKFTEALEALSEGIDIGLSLRKTMTLNNNYPNSWKNFLVSIFLNRGNLYLKMENFSNALSDYNFCIGIGFELYEELAKYDEYPPDWQNTLAASLMMRGVLFLKNDKLEEAYNDYSNSISLRLNLRERYLGKNLYLPDWQCSLATIYGNRATLLEKMKKTDDALNDYEIAISLIEDLLIKESSQLFLWQDILIKNLINRGNLFISINNKNSALLDFDRSIEIFQLMKQQLIDSAQKFPEDFLLMLADIFNSRRKIHLSNNAYVDYINDINESISIYHTIVENSAKKGESSIKLLKDLSDVLQERAGFYIKIGRSSYAMDDYDQAITYEIEIVNSLAASGNDYPYEWQNNLTKILVSRGLLRYEAGNIESALSDYDLALHLGFELYEKHSKYNGLKLHWQYNLANCLINRAILILSTDSNISSEAIENLVFAKNLLHAMVFDFRIQDYLSALLICQRIILTENINNDFEVLSSARNLIDLIKINYKTDQLKTEELKILQEIQIHLDRN